MSQNSTIEWTEATWNPVRGCTKVSPGCAHCYAETFAERWRGIPGHPYEQGFDLRLVPEKLEEPLRVRKPTTFFVNSMSDLFQDGVPWSFIEQVFDVMQQTPRHTYQVLTKRAENMRLFCEYWAFHHDGPLPNVWLGVSVENQHFADERIPLLLQTPAAVRFISAEPLLGPVNLHKALCNKVRADVVTPSDVWGAECNSAGMVDWVIVGGESGPGARPFDLDWGRSIVDQCGRAGVAVFVKQIGARWFDRVSRTAVRGSVCVSIDDARRVTWIKPSSSKGGDMAEWPEDLRVRQMPQVTTSGAMR